MTAFTLNDVDEVAATLPGGLDGLLKQWGLHQFGQAVLARHGMADAYAVACLGLEAWERRALAVEAQVRDLESKMEAVGAGGVSALRGAIGEHDRNSVLEEAAALMDQTGRISAAALIRGLKSTHAAAHGGGPLGDPEKKTGIYEPGVASAADVAFLESAANGLQEAPGQVDPRVVRLFSRLESYRVAFDEWIQKTDFIQDWISSGKLPAKYLGWHRADVMRDLIKEPAEACAASRPATPAASAEPVAWEYFSTVEQRWCPADPERVEFLRRTHKVRPLTTVATPANKPWQELAATVYQACGGYDMPARVLDLLSAAANGQDFAHLIEGVLPCCAPAALAAPKGEAMDDVLNDALSNLEHDNYERSHKGYENRQADVALIRAALASAPVADTYVEARECGACGHVGINDSSDTQAACKNFDWSGDSPKEDHCPGCAQHGTMTAACPKCGSDYRLLADRTLEVASAPVAGEAQSSVRSLQRYGFGYADDGNGGRYLSSLKRDDGAFLLRDDVIAALASGPAAQPPQDSDVEMVSMGGTAPAVPRWLLDAAQRIQTYMDAHSPGAWAVGGIQKRQAPASDGRDAKDAARYRWLRNYAGKAPRTAPMIVVLDGEEEWHLIEGDLADAAIDAQQGEGGGA